MPKSTELALLCASVFMVLGLATIEITGLRWIFIAGAWIAVVAAAWDGVRAIFLGRMNVGKILSSQTVLWYALPFTYAGFVDYDAYVDIPFIQNAWSLTWITAICLACYVISTIKGLTLYLPDISPYMLKAVIPVVALQTWLIASGQWTYSTLHNFTEGGTSPPLLPLITNDFAPIVAPVCGAIIGSAFDKDKRPSRLTLVVAVAFVLIQMIWWIAVGRRPLTIIITMIAVVAFRYAFRGHLTKKAITTFVVGALLMVPAIIVAWDAYYTLRLATVESGMTTELSILQWKEARERASLYQGDDNFEQNLMTRPFIINSVTEVSTKIHGLLWGEEVYTQALRAIPGFLFPDKSDAIGLTAEELWATVARIGNEDMSNTVILEGFVDFWIFGFIVYIFIFSFMIKCLVYIADRMQSDFSLSMIFFGFTYTFFNVETSLTEIFTRGRSILVLMLIVMLWRFVYQNRADELRAIESR